MKTSDVLSFIKAEAVLLTAIPAIAIAISFFFELGYLFFYNVPASVISVDFYKVMVACALFAIYCVVMAEVTVALRRLARKRNRFVRAGCFCLIPVAYLALIIALTHNYEYVWFAIAGVAVLLLFTYLVFSVESDGDSGGQEDSLYEHFKILVFLVMVTFLLSFCIGFNVALEKTKFFVLGSNEILVDIYSDKAVIAGVNQDRNALSGKIRIVAIDSEGLKGELKRLGRLSRYKQKNN